MKFPKILKYEDFKEFFTGNSSIDNKGLIRFVLETEINENNKKILKTIINNNDIPLTSIIDYETKGCYIEGSSPKLGEYNFEFFKTSQSNLLQLIIHFEKKNYNDFIPLYEVLRDYILLTKENNQINSNLN